MDSDAPLARSQSIFGFLSARNKTSDKIVGFSAGRQAGRPHGTPVGPMGAPMGPMGALMGPHKPIRAPGGRGGTRWFFTYCLTA